MNADDRIIETQEREEEPHQPPPCALLPEACWTEEEVEVMVMRSYGIRFVCWEDGGKSSYTYQHI